LRKIEGFMDETKEIAGEVGVREERGREAHSREKESSERDIGGGG